MKTCKKGHDFEGRRCLICRRADYKIGSANEYQRKWREAHREHSKDYSRKWRIANPEKLAALGRRRQGNMPEYPCPGFCESCSKPIIDAPKTPYAIRACSDHDHDTKEWRGWLCHACNKLEGVIRKVDSNDQDVQNVRAYLARKKAKSAA